MKNRLIRKSYQTNLNFMYKIDAVPYNQIQNGGVCVPENIKKRIKFIFAVLFFGFIIYAVVGLYPYTGSLYVSQQTRNAFCMDSFFGDRQIPERVMLLDDPWGSFIHRINVISGAQDQIYMATFSMHSGVTADIIAGALLSAAERGVQVNVMANEVVGNMPRNLRSILAGHENINVYGFNRLNLLRPQRINANFHDKYLIADNTFMLLGGRNMGDKYYNPDCFTGRLSLDTEVLVYNTDPAHCGIISEVRELFRAKAASSRATPVAGRNHEAEKARLIGLYNTHNALHATDFDYFANTVPTNRITLITNDFEPNRKESIIAYNLKRIAMNSDTVIAMSPYLSMTASSIRHFAEMARGRDFTLVTNSLASTPNLPAFSSYYVSRRNILRTGITIYEYQCTDTQLHGKVYLFDQRLTAIGSFNLNERSMRSDTESMLVIDSPQFFDIALASVNGYIASSLRVGADNRYILCGYVEPARVPRGKRTLYIIAGHLLRGLRFMF